MPLLRITTSVELDEKTRSSAAHDFSKTVSQMLGKPENYVMVIINAGTSMLFAGNDAPAAYLELKSLGLPEDKSAGFSASLCAKTAELLGVDTGRIYIEFTSPARHLWGWNNSTF